MGRKNPKPVEAELFTARIWDDIPAAGAMLELALRQLGTIGSGNHTKLNGIFSLGFNIFTIDPRLGQSVGRIVRALGPWYLYPVSTQYPLVEWVLSLVDMARQTASWSAIRAVRGNSSENWIPGMLV